MESYFNTTLESNKETDNIIFNTNILIGLVFCSLIIYYLYTYRKYNILTDEQKFKDKFNNINTNNNILNKYPKIVDFLFYLENFKYKDINNYNNIINSFENFCKIYEYCIIDYNLIFTNYQKLIDRKDIILNQINNFIFIYKNANYENILIKQKISAEKIIDELLNNLVILFKKKIYYDGYNNGTINIDYSNILPYNILYKTNYNEHSDEYNISNLIYI